MCLVLGWAAGSAWVRRREHQRHLEAVRRIREEFAADIHDELGSGLVQVAILGELAEASAPDDAPGVAAEITALARSLHQFAGHMAWSIDPRTDRLADLAERMRGVATQTLKPHGTTVKFDALGAVDAAVTMSPVRRRHLLLMFQEAVTNIARHAGATEVNITLQLDKERVQLAIADNGRGFMPTAPSTGLGLDSLRRRTRTLKGSIDVHSRPGAGTALHVDVPLRG